MATFIHWMYGHSATQLCSDSMVKFSYTEYIFSHLKNNSCSNIYMKMYTVVVITTLPKSVLQ